jgi:hypothetical protein
MARDQDASDEISLIIITDDPQHSRELVASLSGGRYRYIVAEVTDRKTMIHAFSAAVEAARGKRPVVALFDWAFLRDQATMFVWWVRTLQRCLAIECVVTRAPAEMHLRRRLTNLGASLFDGCASVAEPISMH